MHQIELILVCLGIGVVLRLFRILPDTTPKVLGGWVINVALPATALRSLHDVSIDTQWWIAAATPWIAVGVAIAVLVPLARIMGWTRQRTGALLLVSGWGNTSFVGLPVIAGLAGSQWLGLGLVIDLFGSYLSLSIIGIAIVSICSSYTVDLRSVLRRIVTFPPFLAILVAIATNHLDRAQWIDLTVEALASTLTPLALATVGFALRLDAIAGRLTPMIAGLGFRLIVAPLVLMLLCFVLGTIDSPVSKIAILEMAMPPMLGASLLAMNHDLEPDLVTLMIGVGVPLSLLTAPAIWWLMESI